ncbi:MAG: hypothetical protein A2798_01740 [Candidatus Levybacteria bacterium RIFCSPHIGHO2_01_FULL_37_17]|nr:MAG: hypothetical protein A2798_01740 [Candidatus Levybacteria bacterium RIFCSPHIGHO2_01_FULL_37_17]OGH37170.1 MAG: hypothetical protein A2959_02600 [Candidatus Levybacteria bacterium RIFCSPLOWO2_01_FULL_38_23]
MKKAGEEQWGMYEGYRDDAQYLIDIADQKVPSDQITGNSKARDKRDKAIQKYTEELDRLSNIKDWRIPIISQPLPKECNKDNLFIPETSGSIDWTGEEDKETPIPGPFNFEPLS